ncbi:hypothetical protein I307_05331 [Cryptococcus deuterogattii 99/473]|uniref:Uncharacterized protein n=1 Tax=Cryptococcus deuterogattii Ram5 TaxID=1296110 RepID=A0A0D0V7L1_9TREE|nr:hypothetical protein I309_05234 [Cryptococcus deuterogattii LA55]KIR33219.1 hypothetical protein I352_04590 [Cryptococcus deuterogattii MMRL2647]KIR40905.1 hypothetical protein I313_02851 [Cryptococcus deuterogattii Ram5]KIR72261.1 hypothetical protein I310_03663 [Cryptococcus deuterogattii CA1014]KIR91852.1 hypothetical protein I304_04014 [Cryptococcus deuterogattii CBS 10090]KIR97665.1 hypothetical protein L804_04807 [Cryptococcus deuterogattii 2001/935-1]KIY55314.1 hypothetical protein 
MPSREFGEDDRRSSKANRFGEINVWVVWRGFGACEALNDQSDLLEAPDSWQ